MARIVGRDTQNLDAAGVAKAAIETVAENFSDGVAAPLFYLVIGGAPLGLCYKAINTMDSMVGYKNDRYLYFGRAAAKLDDVANYIPARISAFLMMFAALLTGQNAKHAFQIWKRDRYNHASPNSASKAVSSSFVTRSFPIITFCVFCKMSKILFCMIFLPQAASIYSFVLQLFLSCFRFFQYYFRKKRRCQRSASILATARKRAVSARAISVSELWACSLSSALFWAASALLISISPGHSAASARIEI